MGQTLTRSEMEMLHLRISASPANERDALFAQLDELIGKIRNDHTLKAVAGLDIAHAEPLESVSA